MTLYQVLTGLEKFDRWWGVSGATLLTYKFVPLAFAEGKALASCDSEEKNRGFDTLSPRIGQIIPVDYLKKMWFKMFFFYSAFGLRGISYRQL